MSEYRFDEETVRALLAAALPVRRVIAPEWQPGAPDLLLRVVIAGVASDPELSDVLDRREAAHSCAWLAGTHEDESSPWAILDVTFESGLKKSFHFDLETQAESLERVVRGGELFVFDDRQSGTATELLEKGVLVARGGSEALRRQLKLCS